MSKDLESAPHVLSVSADMESVATVAEFIERWLEAIDCPQKIALRIMTAQDEIFSNIVRYAYGGKGGEATVELSCEGGFAVIRMSDGGIPFDPLKAVASAPRTASAPGNIGGDGIRIVLRLMDECEYSYANGRNVFTMKKALS